MVMSWISPSMAPLAISHPANLGSVDSCNDEKFLRFGIFNSASSGSSLSVKLDTDSRVMDDSERSLGTFSMSMFPSTFFTPSRLISSGPSAATTILPVNVEHFERSDTSWDVLMMSDRDEGAHSVRKISWFVFTVGRCVTLNSELTYQQHSHHTKPPPTPRAKQIKPSSP